MNARAVLAKRLFCAEQRSERTERRVIAAASPLVRPAAPTPAPAPASPAPAPPTPAPPAGEEVHHVPNPVPIDLDAASTEQLELEMATSKLQKIWV